MYRISPTEKHRFFRWTERQQKPYLFNEGMLEDLIQNSAIKISEMPTHINM